MADPDVKTFWRLMGARPVSVPVVAARGSDGPAGLLALSATHVTAAPPSMLVCVGQSTSALQTIKSSGAFAISYLPEGAEETAEIFGGRRGLSGANRFADGEWITMTTGAPVFAKAVLALDCRVSAIFVHEGTELVIGRIEDHATGERTPLATLGGRYRGITL